MSDTKQQVPTSAELLRENFDYWRKKLPEEGRGSIPQEASFLLRIPATHTWGYSVTTGANDRYENYLFEKILFSDRALLSSAARRQEAAAPDKSESQLGPNATTAGLANYVFSYLGVHDPYYSRSSYPAFGVFITLDRENSSPIECHASRRDFDSPEATEGGVELTKNYLYPYHGRELARLESMLDSRHKGDMWRYWGNPENYSKSSWEWKVEMRFLKRVNLIDFKAILWPVHRKSLSAKGGLAYSNRLQGGAQRFQEENPYCKVIRYMPDLRRGPDIALIQASCLAAKFFCDSGDFPSLIDRDGGVLS